VEYSNTNTVLLGMVIEQVTGKPFAEVLRTNLLGPLGLEQTSFPGDSSDLPSPHLDGVTIQAFPEGDVKDATNFNPSWGFTSGAMISTLDDLHKWSVALGTGEGWVSDELQKERVASMTSSVAGNTPEQAYALGFGVANGWIGHTGELPGYNTSIVYDPKSGTSIVVMVNSDIPSGSENPAPYISAQLQAVLGRT
jgi:D-alanyl-D-alanine carboxypeptidase